MAGNVTISDVAKAAGVSISTVSRVINNNPRVEPAMAENVRRAVKELNYVPNVFARSLKGDKSGTIGIVIPSAYDNFFARVLEGALSAADRFGLRALVYSCHGDASMEAKCLKSAADAGIAGLLYCPSSEPAAQQMSGIFLKGFPSVIVYRRNVVKGVPHIYHDNIKGGYLACKYLLKQRRREIAFFAGAWEQPSKSVDEWLSLMGSPMQGAYSSLDRLQGHLMALEEEGVEFDKSLIAVTGYDYESGYKRAKEFLSTLRDFDAVICSNDSVASGVLQALREQNIVVPEQVSIIGYDDSVFATITRPQLTSVRQQPIELGFGSIEMLIQRMTGKTVEDRVVDVSLVVRNSTSVKQ